jgi:hypothetical protein
MSISFLPERPSDNAHDFAAAFACAVTAVSTDENAWVAKNGDESVFSVMSQLFPQVAFSTLVLETRHSPGLMPTDRRLYETGNFEIDPSARYQKQSSINFFSVSVALSLEGHGGNA